MASHNIIELRDLGKVYDLGAVQVPALRGLDFEVEEGSYTAIMGPSGSGKSTMLNILGCLDQPTSGRYFLGEQDVSLMSDSALSEVRGQRIGFIFQSYNLIPQLDVVENIHVPLFYQGKQLSGYRKHCEDLADLVGLADRLDTEVDRFAEVSHERATQEAAHKLEYSSAIVHDIGKDTVAKKEATAHLRSKDTFLAWKLAEAKEKATQPKEGEEAGGNAAAELGGGGGRGGRGRARRRRR